MLSLPIRMQFISVMPTNLYGPNDNYDLKNSHVLPALIRKFHEARINRESDVTIWGTGEPKREFLHVDDVADACFFLMENYNDPGLVNVEAEGPHHYGTRRIVSANRGLQLVRSAGSVQTRRHTPQTNGRIKNGSHGLEGPGFAGRWDTEGV